MAKHLQTFSTAAQWPAKAASVAADEIAIADSAAGKAPKLVTLSNLAGLSAANTTLTPITNMVATDVQAALAELQADVDGLSAVTGQYEGSSATFAGLPAVGGAVADGDWSLLTDDDGGNLAGIYVVAGGVWTLGKAIPPVVLAVMTGATAGAAGTSGIVPIPAAGDQVNVLTGAATYVAPATLIPDYVGATAGTAGVRGLMPAAAAGDEGKFITGAGTYLTAPAAALQATTDVGSVTTNDIEITVATAGIILRDTGAQRYRLTIDTDGGLITTAI